MPVSFEEFLRSQGASAEDVKALSEGSFSSAARRAFDALQKQAADAIAAAEATEAARVADRTKLEAWFNDEQVPAFKAMEQKLVVSQANEARAKEAILAAQRQGLLDVAKDLGYNPEEPVKPAPTAPAPIDTSKFVTTDNLTAMADQVGAGLAALEDMVMEHRLLFPDKPLSVRKLREEAVAAKKPVHEYWEQAYHVPEARAAREKADKDAYEARLRAEGAAAEREKYANPDTRPLVTSSNPFTLRKEGDMRAKQPWDAGSEALGRDRVSRETQKIVKDLVQ